MRKNKRKELPFGCSSKIAVCAVFCLICCIAVFFAVKWDSLSPESLAEWFSFSDSSKDSFEVDISGTSVMEKNFESMDGGLLYISDTSVVGLDHDGEKQYGGQHNFTNPQLKCSNSYSIAYNAGGSDFRIMTPKSEHYRGTQGNSITDCDINNMGTYGIISDQTGYLSKLSVYDKNNEFVYGYSFNDYYAVSVSLSPDGNMAAVGSVNTVDGQFVTVVYLLDFTSTEPLFMFKYDDCIIHEVKFIGEDRFAVVTDTLISVISTDNGKEIPYSYDKKVLTAYNIEYESNIVLSLSRSNDERDCTVVVLDPKGSEIGSFDTDIKIYSIDVKKDKIALLSSNMLYLRNAYGDSFGEWEVGNDAKSVIIPQEKTAYILGVSEIRKVRLK